MSAFSEAERRRLAGRKWDLRRDIKLLKRDLRDAEREVAKLQRAFTRKTDRLTEVELELGSFD